jgi:hypothetical protein
MEKFQSIRVVKVSKARYCISIVWEGTRYRFSNGQRIGSWSKPQLSPTTKRLRAYESLCSEFQRAIALGWTPTDDWSEKLAQTRTNAQTLLDDALASKLRQGLSESYSRKLIWIVGHLRPYLKNRPPTPLLLASFINESHWSAASRAIIRRHLMAFEKELEKYGYEGSIRTLTSKTRTVERLHRPFKNVEAVLEEVLQFDKKLHLCCLLAYGCLLRPHREIRLLTWGDISEDLRQISLGGNQTKAKRNRIVPIAGYIQQHLILFRDPNYCFNTNVFSGCAAPYNRDYFKTLWSRYKRQSKILEQDQTLYSFRHSGSVNVYEKTGSLVKLQQVMGHSSLQVSLTYLRGLDVKQLDIEDMPSLLIRN